MYLIESKNNTKAYNKTRYNIIFIDSIIRSCDYDITIVFLYRRKLYKMLF